MKHVLCKKCGGAFTYLDTCSCGNTIEIETPKVKGVELKEITQPPQGICESFIVSFDISPKTDVAACTIAKQCGKDIHFIKTYYGDEARTMYTQWTGIKV